MASRYPEKGQKIANIEAAAETLGDTIRMANGALQTSSGITPLEIQEMLAAPTRPAGERLAARRGAPTLRQTRRSSAAGVVSEFADAGRLRAEVAKLRGGD